MSDLWKELRSRRRARATLRFWRSAECQWRGEIERLKDALHYIQKNSDKATHIHAVASIALNRSK